MAIAIITNTDLIEVTDVQGTPSLEQLQEWVGGYIELVHLDAATQLVVNEDGLIIGLPLNVPASNLTGMHLVGNVVVLTEDNILKPN